MKQIVAVIGRLALGSSLWFSAMCWAQIPASFFGMHPGHTNHDAALAFPLQIRYGNYRNLASGQTWMFLNSCPAPNTSVQCRANPTLTTINFSKLDMVMANLKAAGVDNVMFTLGMFTPPWATTRARAHCGPATDCYPPDDMNADGTCSGSIGRIRTACAMWDNWVENVAAHLNAAGYSSTHAHVKYWEPLNEIFSNYLISDCCGPFTNQNYMTYAQVLRFTEDTNCIVTGRGTIHNFPKAGSSASCFTYLAGLGYSALDPTAQIVLPSQSPLNISGTGGHNLFRNLLYCNADPVDDNGATTTCTWSGGLNWMSAAVDIINFHFYVTNEQPEQDLAPSSARDWITTIENEMTATDRVKPLWNTEGSCGVPNYGRHIWNDSYSMAAFVPRYMALLWSGGVTETMWYEYQASCSLNNSQSGRNTLTPAGVAWNSTYQWLVGGVPTNTPFCSSRGTVWTCPFTEANSKPAELVWDSKYGPGGTTPPADCSNAPTPTICGSTAYTVPAPYSADWIDVAGTLHPFTPTVTIGATPILLEGSPKVTVKGRSS
jgi:hypothetical protein